MSVPAKVPAAKAGVPIAKDAKTNATDDMPLRTRGTLCERQEWFWLVIMAMVMPEQGQETVNMHIED
jgi:hypothetical protein